MKLDHERRHVCEEVAVYEYVNEYEYGGEAGSAAPADGGPNQSRHAIAEAKPWLETVKSCTVGRKVMEERDEAALVAAVRSGDAVAFEDLIRPYEGRVYQTVLRIVRNEADAADVYQGAIMRAFENLDGFRGDAAFGTWLHQIGVNAALMHRRSAQRNPTTAEADLPRFNWMGGYARPVQDWSESAEDRVYRSQLRKELSAALDQLPHPDRTVVWLKDALGLSHDEIAMATDSTVLAVRSRLHRARLRLRERLAGLFGGDR
ncbi:sigma-70 family RNA polymerase sigma factor [Candidatus Binatia bacterium]|nr:sigma-70 family RNA polymerase sigma factor [Candidatus Binatia bacterium]